MDLDTYQKAIAVFDLYPPEKVLEYTALGLANESGEYAGRVKKWIRHDRDTIDSMACALELGDILWYLSRAASGLGFSLSEIAEMNYSKLAQRQKKGSLRGDGDLR